jgi:nuclear cap-binding protein subunit 1
MAVPKPHLSFEAQLVDGKSHDVSSISCPPPTLSQSSSEILKGQEKHEADLKYPQRLRRLHIFPTNKAEVASQAHDLRTFVFCMHSKLK